MTAVDYDFWLFDLDGTIIDVEESYPLEVFDEVGDRLGHEFSEREVEVLWYGLGETRRRTLDELGVDPVEFWEVFHDVEDPMARAEATFVYDDAESVVPAIDEPVGLVTHCQSYLTGPILDELDIADWFDAVVCCTDEIGWKPDPRPVERTIAELGVGHNGHEGVLAGDDPADVGAAWNGGLDSVHVQRFDPDERGLCVMGDYRVQRLTELDRNGET
jgi:phosphoglycolate phosphatase